MSQEAKKLLTAMEQELRRLNCWQSMPPSSNAMASTTPFCMDTMGFTQWLQWVFIPRVRAILDQKTELPKGADIKPYAEEALRVERVTDTRCLIDLVAQFDELMS
ncbi:glyoxalase I [Endozoicomonas sp. OPT23]|uniref:YqcC family protein n=1 Tax=Endozoicomonas sp. OPT23 TaxID=2072845 RepID=UPI00129BB7CB|nr:YqcC family protein [Endozoicomonas sp. OPT23]MRI31736.1 glyoxalase I [Endozoicomonas sp. OPT23]